MRISDWSSDVCSSDLPAGGSVRHAGDTVRITAQLIRAADGSTLWSEHYDRPFRDLFALQDEITREVASALKARSAEHTSELQSLMRISYAVVCLHKTNNTSKAHPHQH